MSANKLIIDYFSNYIDEMTISALQLSKKFKKDFESWITDSSSTHLNYILIGQNMVLHYLIG